MRPPETLSVPTTQIGAAGTLIYDSLESTNDFITRWATDETHHGLVILAREQTAGKGQHGRKWSAPRDTSVLLSTLVFPPKHFRRPVQLTAWASLSVCRTIEQLVGASATIKWPNDVIIHGKNIAGILVEQRQGIIVGIGLNVSQNQAFFDEAELPDATSLRLIKDTGADFLVVARTLIAQLDSTYRQFLQGEWQAVEPEWCERFRLRDREVVVEQMEKSTQGKLTKLSFNELEIELATGERYRIAPELVKQLRPLSAVIVELYGIPRLRARRSEMVVSASTVGEVLREIQLRCPDWSDLLHDGKLAPHYRLSLDGETFLTDPSSRILSGARLLLLSADVGG